MHRGNRTYDRRVAWLRGCPMILEERGEYIVGLAHRHFRVLVEELSESLDISRSTIRKDLDYLQRRTLLHRTHGRVTAGQCRAFRSLLARMSRAIFAGIASYCCCSCQPRSGRPVRSAGFRRDDTCDRKGTEALLAPHYHRQRCEHCDRAKRH